MDAIAAQASAMADEATAIQNDVTKNHAARQEENAKIFCYRRDFLQVVDCAQVTVAADGPDPAIVRNAVRYLARRKHKRVVWMWMLVVGGGEAIEDGTQGSDCFREKVGTSYAPGGSPTEQMRFESSKSAIAPLHGIG
jgi:hypothetical protein